MVFTGNVNNMLGDCEMSNYAKKNSIFLSPAEAVFLGQFFFDLFFNFKVEKAPFFALYGKKKKNVRNYGSYASPSVDQSKKALFLLP